MIGSANTSTKGSPRVAKTIALLLAFLVPTALHAQTVLLMAEEPGCYWCERWTEEIGPIYPKTAEGQAAPLVKFDILQPPEHVKFAMRINFTPTFILVQDDVEIGRIEGYPGEDFFWGLLGQLIDQTKDANDTTG